MFPSIQLWSVHSCAFGAYLMEWFLGGTRIKITLRIWNRVLQLGVRTLEAEVLWVDNLLIPNIFMAPGQPAVQLAIYAISEINEKIRCHFHGNFRLMDHGAMLIWAIVFFCPVLILGLIAGWVHMEWEHRRSIQFDTLELHLGHHGIIPGVYTSGQTASIKQMVGHGRDQQSSIFLQTLLAEGETGSHRDLSHFLL